MTSNGLRGRRPLRALVAALASLIAASAADGAMAQGGPLDAPGVRILDADGAPVSSEALLDRLAEADLAILGEIHDNPVHHQAQAWAVAALAARPPGLAGLAFEMVPEAREDAVNALRRAGAADPAALAEAIGWADLGWPDFAYYAPIFAAAPEATVTGGQPPRAELMRLAQAGAAADPLAAKFGLDAALPEAEQAAREAAQIAAHCDALPAAMAPMLVAAQRVRDAHFAEALLRAKAAGPGRAALIAGSGHARVDHGVPALVRRAAPHLRVVSVGMVEEGDAAAESESAAAEPPFDFVIVAPAHPREDPCLAFRKKP